jgi:hypothetical protein
MDTVQKNRFYSINYEAPHFAFTFLRVNVSNTKMKTRYSNWFILFLESYF